MYLTPKVRPTSILSFACLKYLHLKGTVATQCAQRYAKIVFRHENIDSYLISNNMREILE